MTYYKIILDHDIVGIVNTNDFIAFSPVIESFLRSDEKRGEYVNWRGKIYRDTWMAPIQFHVDFIQADIQEIAEEEYHAFEHAFEVNEIIIEEQKDDEEEEIEESQYINPVDEESVNFIRQSKIAEMSRACRNIIEAGFDILLSDNEIHHFSLDTQDQLNLITLSALAEVQDSIPYHADGEICKFYSAAEIKQIVAGATQFKMYHTTYYNALKNYINNLDNISDIAAITYGTALPEEYQSDVLKALT